MTTRMKSLVSNRWQVAVCALVATCAMLPVAAEDAGAELELVRQRVAEMFDMIEANDVSVSPVDETSHHSPSAVIETMLAAS